MACCHDPRCPTSEPPYSQCPHQRIIEVRGEPTIGPYYRCADCGKNLTEWEALGELR